MTLSEEIGKVIRGTYADEQEKRQALVEITDGFELFKENSRCRTKVKGGFNLGRVKLSEKTVMLVQKQSSIFKMKI